MPDDFGDLALLDLFRAELETHLPALNDGLLTLEKNPDNARLYEALMRAAHSVKGAARIVGIEAAARVAHVLEDCFVAAQNGQLVLGADAVDVLLRGVDALGRIGNTNPPNEHAIGGPDALAQLIDDLKAVRAGTTPAPVIAVPAAAMPAPSGVLKLTGDLNESAAEALREQLRDLVERGETIRLDLAGVGVMGPASLALFAALARGVPADGPRPELANTPSAIRDLFRLTRLDQAFAFA